MLPPRSDLNRTLWAALVLASEDRLTEDSRTQIFGRRRGPDVTIARWEQMARDYLARSDVQSGEDPLAGSWALLRQTLMKTQTDGGGWLPVNRTKFAAGLAQHLAAAPDRGRPAWFANLRDLLATHASEAEDDEENAFDASDVQ
jgi:hypothetical protein